MKMIYLTTFSFMFLAAFISLSSLASAAVCQNKTAIIYSNGMFNDRKTAEKARQRLEDEIYIQLGGSQLLVELEVSYLAYASGGSQYVPQVASEHPIMKLLNLAIATPNAIGQVGEVVLQKIFQDDVSAFIRWIAGLQAAGSTLQNIMSQLASGANAASYVYTPELDAQLVIYKELLNSGKRVMIVSHSQGNFYANAAYSKLILANPVWANSIGNVQVATPAADNLGGKLGNNEPQITVPEDLIMTITHALSLNLVMPTKPSRGNLGPPNKSLNYNELGGLIARNAATYGHNFVKWYLAGTYTRDFIMKGIVDTVNGVAGGYAGLQYSACSFYRNDWGYYDNSGWRYVRDDYRNLAYELKRTYLSYAQTFYDINVIDTYSGYKESFVGIVSSLSGEVLPWSGGLVGTTAGKLSIMDAGQLSRPRWVVRDSPVTSLTVPTYDIEGYKYSPYGPPYPATATPSSDWNREGSYDVGKNHYRIPMVAGEVGSSVSYKISNLSFIVPYGVIDINDGNVSFIRLSSVTFRTQPWPDRLVDEAIRDNQPIFDFGINSSSKFQMLQAITPIYSPRSWVLSDPFSGVLGQTMYSYSDFYLNASRPSSVYLGGNNGTILEGVLPGGKSFKSGKVINISSTLSLEVTGSGVYGLSISGVRSSMPLRINLTNPIRLTASQYHQLGGL